MANFTIQTRSLDETDRLGKALADAIERPLTLALSGTLGAGKTRFVQGLAAAWNVPRESVVSPTFVLCQQYEGDWTIYHLDAYRLRDDDEFLQLGVEEYFEAPAITVIEWADRVEACLPESRLDIEIRAGEQSVREFQFRGRGAEAKAVVERLEACWSGR